jgi:hypothetical protein
MSNVAVGPVYDLIISEVINAVRVDFEENGVEEGVLEELKKVRLLISPSFLPLLHDRNNQRRHRSWSSICCRVTMQTLLLNLFPFSLFPSMLAWSAVK